MKKKIVVVFLACLGMLAAPAQTLFTYGKYSVDTKDFLKAYYKNNLQPVGPKAKSIADYLDLYINSKLKIREAYDRGYDTLPQLKIEMATLRSQISENYMNDPETVSRLKKEAFDRSQKDIRVAHIFVSFKNTGGAFDTATSRRKKDEVLQRLQKGEDFLQVAKQLSDDATATTNSGELGYITVFTLPYEFETVIYATPVGKYSSLVPSKIGYHIFKNMGERKAVGKIKAQQILLALPPGADEAAQKKVVTLADSLYKRILAGDNFNKLAAVFSSDYISATNGGTMADIGIGQFDPSFEKTLWALPKDGAVSKPFLTAHGWHILKRTSLKPVSKDINDKANQQELLTKIMADNRWKLTRDFNYKKVMEKGLFKKHSYEEAAIAAWADSLLDLRPLRDIGKTITTATPLFTIGDSTYITADWINYSKLFRYKPDGSGNKSFDQLTDEFIQFAVNNYYKDHLEDFNDDFRNQLAEFRDGNIFFEIMQQEIWNKSQADTSALRALYEKNKKNYAWNKAVDAVVFFCSDESIAKTIYDRVKKDPANWRTISKQFSEKVASDSARFESAQLINLFNVTPKPGLLTPQVVNTNENTTSFAYIFTTYDQPRQKSLEEAKGLLVSDYQAVLDKQWTEALKKKYPVVINQKVLAEISN